MPLGAEGRLLAPLKALLEAVEHLGRFLHMQQHAVLVQGLGADRPERQILIELQPVITVRADGGLARAELFACPAGECFQHGVAVRALDFERRGLQIE